MKKISTLLILFSFIVVGIAFPNISLDTIKLTIKDIATKNTKPKKSKSIVKLKKSSAKGKVIESNKQNNIVTILQPMAPTITASNTVAVNGGGIAMPGSQVDYTVLISNSGMDATGVKYTDVLNENLTLVPGSLKASPIAVNDSYTSVGNVGITVPVEGGVLQNDINPISVATMTISAFDATSTNGGTVSMTTSGANLGAFTYSPAPGFNGSDQFTYTIDNGSGIANGSRTATVTITVTTPIWFINSAAATGGNGTRSLPYNSISDFNANTADDAGDFIYVANGTYSGALTLLNTQKLIGQGATTAFNTITGITPPTYTNALPTTGGTNPTWNTAALTLASGNEIHGVNLNSTSGITMNGGSVGALKVRDASLNNTAGQALQILAGGVLDVQFQRISSAGATIGISVKNSTGSFQVLGTGTAGSGGTIQNIINRGAEFVSCASIVLKNMTFINANTSTSFCASPGNDNTACNAAIHCQSISTLASFDNISITGTTKHFGINLNAVSGLNISNSTITSAGSTNAVTSLGAENGGIFALNLSGTSSISNSNINGSYGRNFQCRNNSGTVNLAVTNCQFKDGFNTSADGSNFGFEGYGTSNNTIVIKSSDFSNPGTYGLFLAFGNSSINNVQVGGTIASEGNTIVAAASSPGSNGFALQTASNHTGSLNYNVLNNNFQ
jgi:trimeric autotransporter adhesin